MNDNNIAITRPEGPHLEIKCILDGGESITIFVPIIRASSSEPIDGPLEHAYKIVNKEIIPDLWQHGAFEHGHGKLIYHPPHRIHRVEVITILSSDSP